MTDQPAVPPCYQPSEIRIIVTQDARFQIVVVAENGNVLLTDRGQRQFGFSRRKALNLQFAFWRNVSVYFCDHLGTLYDVGQRNGVVPYFTKRVVKQELERVGKKRRAR